MKKADDGQEYSWLAQQRPFDLGLRCLFIGGVVWWIAESMAYGVIGGVMWFLGDLVRLLVFHQRLAAKDAYAAIPWIQGGLFLGLGAAGVWKTWGNPGLVTLLIAYALAFGAHLMKGKGF